MSGKTLSLLADEGKQIDKLTGNELFLVSDSNTSNVTDTNVIKEYCNNVKTIELYITLDENNYVDLLNKIVIGDLVFTLIELNPENDDSDYYNIIDISKNDIEYIKDLVQYNIIHLACKNNNDDSLIYMYNNIMCIINNIGEDFVFYIDTLLPIWGNFGLGINWSTTAEEIGAMVRFYAPWILPA